jgi:biopolymer transport protein ExbD
MKRHAFPQAHATIPNLAPMVDVVIVILIFFMLGTSFALMEGSLQTQLPSQVANASAENVSVIPLIRIALRQEQDQPCRISVMNQDLAANNFSALLEFLNSKMNAGADADSRVVISSGPDVRYQNVISAMDACLRAGFTRIQFSVGAASVDAPDREG